MPMRQHGDQVRRFGYSWLLANGSPSVFLSGDIAEKVGKLKQQQQAPGFARCYGSANLVQTLMKHDLVDEFWLKTYPLT